ncbi:hypothetical protein JQN58_04875 [Aneurinibacillus sp. BA2021]|nr:hypothetical protein [Aneurinibacillus sp. BA2021]
MNLSKEIKIVKLASSSTATTGTIESSPVDTTGYEGVLLFTCIKKADPTNVLKVQQGGRDLEGAAMVAQADGQVVFVEVHQPQTVQGKELRVVVERGVSTGVGEIYALLYNGRRRPELNAIEGPDGMIGILLISPDVV